MFRMPYSLVPVQVLEKGSPFFLGAAERSQNLFPFLKVNLRQAKFQFTPKEYLSLCYTATVLFYIFFAFLLNILLLIAGVENFILIGLFIPLVFALFVFMQQLYYPKIHASRRIKSIEQNILPALQNLLIQLNSGVPLFESLVNISKEEYGEISIEMSKVVREINAGKPQIETLEDVAAVNPSVFFRRAVWQLINGIKSGSDMTGVIGEILNLLAEEQVLQIQRYGSQLNPLAMFYMLAVVIAPSLGMTFLIILSSFLALSPGATKLIFWGLYGMVFFFQLMFIGIIKSRRPNLLGD